METINILVIEDQEIFRKSIVKELNQSENMVVVGEAENGKDGLALIAEKDPDCVVLLDFHMPRGPGPEKLELIQQAKKINPSSKLIIITGEHNPYLLSLMLAAGANSISIILKNDVHDTKYLIRIIENTYQNKYSLPKGEELNYQINVATAERNDFTNSLNDTEMLATILLSDEYPLEDIAAEIKKSPDYIRHVLHNAREKRNLKNNEALKQLYRKLFPIKYFIPKLQKIKYKTGDKAPRPGNYKQIETGEIMWHEKGDEFPPYDEKVGEDKNGAPLYAHDPRKAHYEYIGK